VKGPRSAGDKLLSGASGGATLLVLLSLALLLGTAVVRGLPVLSVSFVFGRPGADPADGGLLPVLVGTFACTVLMTVACVPLGVTTAVWLAEYAPRRGVLARVIGGAIRNLAAVPSIVFGLFGLGFFVLFAGVQIDALFSSHATTPVFARPAIVWSSLTLALLTLPVVVVTTEEALRAVPREVREGAHALGATRLQVVWRVALPQARGGIFTGVILAVSRGAGEVAPLLFTGVVGWQTRAPTSLHDGFMHLGNHVYVLATQAPDVERARPALYGTVLLLLSLTFALNLGAVLLRRRGRAGALP
jgi:phosphate transport system permease protein